MIPSPSSRYWDEDILEEPIEFSQPGKLRVPDRPGIGVKVNQKRLNKYTNYLKVYQS